MTLALAARNIFIGERQVNVLLHGEVVEQVVALKDHAHILLGELGALLALHLVHALLAEPVFALPLVIEQGEHIEQRRLARSRRTHDGDEFALTNFQINAAQDPGLSGGGFVAAFDAFELDHFPLDS